MPEDNEPHFQIYKKKNLYDTKSKIKKTTATVLKGMEYYFTKTRIIDILLRT